MAPRLIYGSIIGLALVVALEKHPPGAMATAASLLGTALAVGPAELYSEWIGRGAREGHGITAAERRQLFEDTGIVTFGAGFPAVFFLAAAAGILEIDAAFTLSKWTVLGLIFAYGFAGARLAGASAARAVVEASLVGAIGSFLIALKALVS